MSPSETDAEIEVKVTTDGVKRRFDEFKLVIKAMRMSPNGDTARNAANTVEQVNGYCFVEKNALRDARWIDLRQLIDSESDRLVADLQPLLEPSYYVNHLRKQLKDTHKELLKAADGTDAETIFGLVNTGDKAPDGADVGWATCSFALVLFFIMTISIVGLILAYKLREKTTMITVHDDSMPLLNDTNSSSNVTNSTNATVAPPTCPVTTMSGADLLEARINLCVGLIIDFVDCLAGLFTWTLSRRKYRHRVWLKPWLGACIFIVLLFRSVVAAVPTACFEDLSFFNALQSNMRCATLSTIVVVILFHTGTEDFGLPFICGWLMLCAPFINVIFQPFHFDGSSSIFFICVAVTGGGSWLVVMGATCYMQKTRTSFLENSDEYIPSCRWWWIPPSEAIARARYRRDKTNTKNPVPPPPLTYVEVPVKFDTPQKEQKESVGTLIFSEIRAVENAHGVWELMTQVGEKDCRLVEKSERVFALQRDKDGYITDERSDDERCCSCCCCFAAERGKDGDILLADGNGDEEMLGARLLRTSSVSVEDL